MNKKFSLAILLVVATGISTVVFYRFFGTNTIRPIGGDRDKSGCLTPAGYTYDAEVSACIRGFEMTADIKRAASLAVQKVGASYALTVVSFNSYEEFGAYDIMLERGIERSKQTVYIKKWQVSKVSTSTYN